uniref:Uncharacterized protein n=1 Tax=Rhizophora mucronata TaxID=61149 RepID=A0A2P2KLQ2_RHIMU
MVRWREWPNREASLLVQVSKIYQPHRQMQRHWYCKDLMKSPLVACFAQPDVLHEVSHLTRQESKDCDQLHHIHQQLCPLKSLHHFL